MESKEAYRIKQTSSLGVGTQEPAGSLLDGMYDEASSAASFQQALAKWRAERVGESKTTSERGENTNNTRGTLYYHHWDNYKDICLFQIAQQLPCSQHPLGQVQTQILVF